MTLSPIKIQISFKSILLFLFVGGLSVPGYSQDKFSPDKNLEKAIQSENVLAINESMGSSINNDHLDYYITYAVRKIKSQSLDELIKHICAQPNPEQFFNLAQAGTYGNVTMAKGGCIRVGSEKNIDFTLCKKDPQPESNQFLGRPYSDKNKVPYDNYRASDQEYLHHGEELALWEKVGISTTTCQ